MKEINWQKHLYLWCKNKGYAMDTTFIKYRDTLNRILRKFPNLEHSALIDIQEYAASIENDNYRKNTCVVIRWAFSVVLKNPIDFRDLQRKVYYICNAYQRSLMFTIHSKNNRSIGATCLHGLR